MGQVEIGLVLALDGIMSLMAFYRIEEDGGGIGERNLLAVSGEEDVADEEGEEGEEAMGRIMENEWTGRGGPHGLKKEEAQIKGSG